MTGPAARNQLPGEPEHRQRWTDAHPTPEQVAEALDWLGWFASRAEGPTLGQVQTRMTLVRAALAAESTRKKVRAAGDDLDDVLSAILSEDGRHVQMSLRDRATLARSSWREARQ